MRTRTVIVSGARPLSPNVRELSLRCADGEGLQFRAGQWVHLHHPDSDDDGSVSRSYSIASPPDADSSDGFQIAVTRVQDGPMSNLLHELPVGGQLEMDGPHGFFLCEAPPPAVFVGAGTGLAPLRSMIGAMLRERPQAEITLLFGCRTQHDVLWRSELAGWASHHPGFRYEVTLSQPSTNWTGRRGYVQSHLRELVGNYADPHVYICGLSKMVREVRQLLKQDLGMDRRRIHSERYD